MMSVEVGERYADLRADATAAEDVAGEYGTTAEAVRNAVANVEAGKGTAGEQEIYNRLGEAMEAKRGEMSAEAIRKRIEDENECSVDAILGKSPDKRTQAEQAVVERYLEELYPEGMSNVESGKSNAGRGSSDGRNSSDSSDSSIGEGPAQDVELVPIGHGVFGDVYDQFRGNAQGAIAFLEAKQGGEAVGALHHKDVGDISLVWGNDKAGLKKILQKHPEVVDNLQGVIDGMQVVQSSDNRIVLESDTHKAVVSKMLGQEKTPQWLLTAYEKKNASGGSSDIDPEPQEGMQNGTAPLQSDSSGGKGTTNVSDVQGRAERDAARAQAKAEAEAALEEAFAGREEMLADAKDDPWETLRDPELTSEQRDAVVQYLNNVESGKSNEESAQAAQTMQPTGMSSEVAQATARRINHESGMVVPARIAPMMGVPAEDVYIVSGEVRMQPDGSGIDRGNSDSFIVVCDGDGNYHATSPERLESVGEAMTPEQLAQTLENNGSDGSNGRNGSNGSDGSIGEAPAGYDVQGNPVDVQGRLVVENVGSMDEITDGDFETPTRNVQLPDLPENVSTAIGSGGKPVVIKKSVFEKNRDNHPEIDAAESRSILERALYNPDLVGSVQARRRPYYRVAIQTGDRNAVVVLDIYDGKDNTEIVGWREINERGLERMRRQAAKDDGQLIILSPSDKPGSAAALSTLQDGLSSGGKGSEKAADAQGVQAAGALSRVPVDAKGEPMFEAAEDASTAWDALVEYSGGDAATAREIVSVMVEQKRKGYERAQKLKPKGKTPAEILSSKRDIDGERARTQQEYDRWRQMSEVERERAAAAEREREAEARRLAAEQAERERAARAAQAEADRRRLERLNGVPDWRADTADAARARGYRRSGPEVIERQGAVDAVRGKAVRVKFAKDTTEDGVAAVIDVEALQPSHVQGVRNVRHFIPEAQPKDRKDAVSKVSAQDIARDIRPEEITGSITAYTGAPSVNARGETIQGNSRADALKWMYDSEPEQAAKYKAYLVEHAEDFGMDAEDIEAMERPVLVNMLDVDDARAIRLGQYVQSDTESGGVERIRGRVAARKMGADIRQYAERLLSSEDEEASISQLIASNGVKTLQWMNTHGYITDTQYASCFDRKGELTGAAAEDLKDVLYQGIFEGGSVEIEEMFAKLPAKAQRAILATAYRDYDSGEADSIRGEIQQAIVLYNEIMMYPQYAGATNIESALTAVVAWSQQYAFDEASGESYLPAERFSNFALHLAAMYKGMSQRGLQKMFNDLYDTIQGVGEDTLFESVEHTPHTIAEAVYKVLGIEYKPVNGINNGEKGHVPVADDGEVGQGGRRGSTTDVGGRERVAGSGRTDERRRGAVLRDAERGRQGDIPDAQRRQQDNLATPERVRLSDEVDENGRRFVVSDDGTTIFGEITEDSGLTAAPIKLSEGLITNTATNDGYGLVHIEARHGDQIRKAGFKSVVDFVEMVAKNYDVIKEGNQRDGHQTYRVQLTDKHNNTLMVELSADGAYWKINTAGIFKTSYGKNNKEVYNRHATVRQPAVAVGASQGAERGGTQTSSSMVAPTSSGGKGSNKSADAQGENAESSRNGLNSSNGKKEDNAAQIVRLEELLEKPGADKKLVRAEIARLRGEAAGGKEPKKPEKERKETVFQQAERVAKGARDKREGAKKVGYNAETKKWKGIPSGDIVATSAADRFGIITGYTHDPRIIAVHNSKSGRTWLEVEVDDDHAETPERIVEVLEKEGYEMEGRGGIATVNFDSYNEAKAFSEHVREIQKRVDAEREAEAAAKANGRNESAEGMSNAGSNAEFEPVGSGMFGDIYDQFPGDAQGAFALLSAREGGDALGVFHRDGLGDIDVVWGDKRGGLAHIADKHIGSGKSFADMGEAASAIDEIIKGGDMVFENGDKVVFKKDGKVVTIRKNIREGGKKIADKNWVLTAYDEMSADGGVSAIAPVNQGQAAPTTGKSRDKVTTKEAEKQEQGEEGAAADVDAALAAKLRKSPGLELSTKKVKGKVTVNPKDYAPWRKTKEDNERPFLRGVHYEGGLAIATDSYSIIMVRSKYPAAWEGKTIGWDGNALDMGDYSYVPWHTLLRFLSMHKKALYAVDKAAFRSAVEEARADKARGERNVLDYAIGVPYAGGEVYIALERAELLVDLMGKVKNGELRLNNTGPYVCLSGDGVYSIHMGLSKERMNQGSGTYVVDMPQAAISAVRAMDSQGNPVNADGTLKLERVSSVDEITDADFAEPKRNVQLPELPYSVDLAIGANGKPVIIKKNIFEKNRDTHKFSFAESRDILKAALYGTDLVGRTQPTKKPLHWVVIKLDEKSPIVVLEVNENKDNIEIVGWYTLDERNLNRIKRQAEKNGGELVMLSPKDKVGSLSTPLDGLSSGGKGSNKSAGTQMKQNKADGAVAEGVEASEAVLRDAVVEKLRESGLEVITDVEAGQKVLDEANGKDVRTMSFGEPYDYSEYPRGRAEKGLADKKVDVVTADANHGFANYREAKEWAKRNISRVYDNEETGGKGDVRISNTAIDKYLSQSAVNKSDRKDVHLAVLRVLPEVLKTSVDAETHPDFLKGDDGKRSVENGFNKDVLVHRCYGAVELDGEMYRVKITLKEDPRDVSSPHTTHSYEATKIELIAGTWENRRGPSPNTKSSISGANLLKDVEMSYDKGKKLLDESKKRDETIREHRVYHGSGADFDNIENNGSDKNNGNDVRVGQLGDHVRFFRTAGGEAYGFTVGGKIYIDPRIAMAETPIHEYAHLWAEALRCGNAAEWSNVVGLMKDTPVWAEVRERYPELESEDEIADEVIATYSGRRGAERLRQEAKKVAEGKGSVFEKAEAISALARVKAALARFWKGVCDFLHIHYKSAEEVADRVMKDLLDGVNPRDVLRKNKQNEVIQRSNPMGDDYHTGVRGVEDIRTMREAISEARAEGAEGGWETLSSYPDVSNAMLEEALRSGRVRVYSSKPIEAGVFVTPSRMQAEDYAGGGRVYSKEVSVDDVAWLNTDEGQLAPETMSNDESGMSDRARMEAARRRSEEAERRDKQLRAQDIATAIVTGKTEAQARAERRERERKYKEETKELYARVLSGDFNEVTLRLINDYLDKVTPLNYYGRPLSKRLPARALRKMPIGERTGSIDALFSRISESAVGAHERAGAEGKRRIEEKKKELLKGWAIATGHWHTDVSDFTDAKEPLGQGKDSDVYVSKDGESVIKVSKGKEDIKRHRPDIDNIALFNYVFPGSKYEIIGYGEIGGKFVRFLRQPIVDFTDSKPLTVEDRVEYMERLGFRPMNAEKTAFTNGEIVASDIQGNNIVKDSLGNVRVIDADMRLHTKDVGGEYTYAPVEKDTEIMSNGESRMSDGPRFQFIGERGAEDMAAVNARFNEELERYKAGEMDKNEVLHLGKPQGVMRAFLPNLPIVMRQRVIRKGSEKKHEVDVSAIKDMPQHLSSPIFVFQRSADTIGVLTDMQDRSGKNVCVAVELKRQMQQGTEYLEVNDVRSFHGREFKNIVEPIANNKTLKWVDKEKGLAYLSSASQPVQQEIDKRVLETATKVVKEFENPKVSGEKVEGVSREAEREAIVASAKEAGTYMKAPNGRATRLTADEWVSVRTKNFKRWFGDWESEPENASKVVDENGEPMVVYHGRSVDFNAFERHEGSRYTVGMERRVVAEGHFFTPDEEFAETYARNAAEVRGGKADVIACFLNIRRPMDLVDNDTFDKTYKEVTGWNYTLADSQDELWSIMDEEGMSDKIKSKGYDGVIFAEELNDAYEPTKISYCILDANQAKYSEGNNGDYSAMEADMRYRTSGELDAEYGRRWLDEQTNSDGRHTTQVKNTLSSYQKFGEWVKREARDRAVEVLDASSGLGIGTEWMRENGINVDDVEPYPSERRAAPTYKNYGDIKKKYDYIISNAVLNVIPDDWRAGLLHDMADKLKDGGRLVINVRSAESIRRQGKEGETRITLDDPSEILVLRPDGSIKAYQKGFTKSELKEWCEKELGAGYSVEIANKGNAGGSYDTAVVVTKNNEGGTVGVASETGRPSRSAQAVSNAGAKIGKKSEYRNSLEEISERMDERGMGAHEFLYNIAKAFGLKGDGLRASFYQDLGNSVGIRISDHTANTYNIANKNGNSEVYGLVVKLGGHRFKPNADADYLEYVYYPDHLDGARQREIVDGLKGFVDSGDYTLLPKPDMVNRSGRFEMTETNFSDGNYSSAGAKGDDRDPGAMAMRARELGERLHTSVRVIRTEEEVAALPSARQRGMKGSYNTRTDEVTVVVPNNADVADVENTVLHEVVGHDGLRVLFPTEEKLNNALDELYRVSDDGIKADIDSRAQKMSEGETSAKTREQYRREATEEYAADLAGRIGEGGFERMSAAEKTFWGRLTAMLQKALQRLLDGLKIRGKRKWSDKEWAFVLHEAFKRKKNGGNPTVFDAADTEVMRRKTGYGEENKGRDGGGNQKETVNLQYGKRLGQDNSNKHNSEKRWDDSQSMAGDASGRLASVGDRGSVRVFEEGLATNRRQHLDDSERDRREAESERLVDIAKENGLYISKERIRDLGQRKHKQSRESEVYINNDAGKVYKVKDPYASAAMKLGVQPEDAIYEYLVHNKYFPETAYTFEGITDDLGDVRIVLSQDLVRSTKRASAQQVADCLAQKGLRRIDGYHFGNDEIEITDVEGDNAFIDENGKVRIIDPVIDFKKPVEEILGDESRDGGIKFRDGDDIVRSDKALARALYEPIIRTSRYQMTEAFQDSMLGLKTLYKAVEKASGSNRDIADIPGYENAYLAENRMSSVVMESQRIYADRYMKPLTDAVAKLAGGMRGKQRVIDYMMAKHGLERNEYMRKQAAENGEETERDFAGLTALTGLDDWQAAEGAARVMVDDFESAESAEQVEALWKAVNAATKKTLKTLYDGGIISRDTYEQVRDMYEYYIPLRGWDETTSDEVYAYLRQRGGSGNVMKKAEGRASKADDPLVAIAGMAESAIMQAEKNKVKQCFLNYALSHPSDLVSVNRLWLQHDEVADEWRPVTPHIDIKDSPEEIDRKNGEFEAHMRALAKAEPDIRRRTLEPSLCLAAEFCEVV